MIFNIPMTIAYLPAGTILKAGSLITLSKKLGWLETRTGPWIGIFEKLQVILNDRDDRRAYIRSYWNVSAGVVTKTKVSDW